MLNNDLIFKPDGDKWCCHDQNFINLQESVAGFGDTKEEAQKDYEAIMRAGEIESLESQRGSLTMSLKRMSGSDINYARTWDERVDIISKINELNKKSK